MILSMVFAPKFATFRILAPEYDPATYRAVFHYAFDKTLEFEEIWEFDPEGRGFENPADPHALRAILAHMAIALAPSYYKLSPAPRIVCEHMPLSTQAREFWKKFYTLGLGEYLYRNDIDPSFIGEFESSQGSQTNQNHIEFGPKDYALVPMGGGKDSIVTVEAVRALGLPAEIVTIGREPNPLHLSVIERTGYPHRFVRRTVDPRMIALAKSGDWPNWHVPVTGMFHFALLALAALTGARYGVFANERSADEGNFEWHGITVNHQYSKSAEFERDFGEYVSREVTGDAEVFSLLRGVGELSIVERFAALPEYHDVFSSCNRNFHIGGSRLAPHERWCGICPKCAFVFLMLSAYLPSAEVVHIFWSDLFAKTELLLLFQSLLGYEAAKPFECVGTHEEAVIAASLALGRDDRPERPVFLDWYALAIAPDLPTIKVERMKKSALQRHWDETRVPERFVAKLEKYFDFRGKKR